ncbi:MAG: ABC transporter substrate-binding protein [Clostridia bacterium]|nr:ABC transporter substrate-binding protein [Clostridia bacterium]
MKRFALVLLSLVMVLSVFAGMGVAEEKTIHPMRYVQPGVLPEDYETGIAAVNEKLLADGYDIEVEIIRIPWGEYDTKLNMMLSTGEEFELLHVMQDVKNMSSLAAMGAILPVDEYLDKYPTLVDKFTETEWLGALYNGEHYAIPCSWRSFDNVMSYMDLRVDVMNAVGYDEFPGNSLDDVIDLMQKSQDYILEETGIKAYNWFHQNQDTAHWLHRTYDSYPFYVENSLGIVLSRQDGTIDSFYESEEFKKDCETYYKLYQAGLVNPDVLNLDHSVMYDDAQLGAFLPSQTFDPYTGVSIKRNTGIDSEVDWVEMNPEKPEMVYTFVQNLNAISATAEDPESGLKFLEWLYASQENHDLFHYGIEGVHYTPIGTDKIDQVLGDDGNALYSMDTWMSGYLPYMRFAADAPDRHVEYMTYKAENYVVSPIAGFIFDASNVQTELSNLQTEIIASIYPIKIGMVSYEENIDQAIANLKAAGLDAYLEEYRTQFAAYLEANPWVLEMAQ